MLRCTLDLLSYWLLSTVSRRIALTHVQHSPRQSKPAFVSYIESNEMRRDKTKKNIGTQEQYIYTRTKLFFQDELEDL